MPRIERREDQKGKINECYFSLTSWYIPTVHLFSINHHNILPSGRRSKTTTGSPDDKIGHLYHRVLSLSITSNDPRLIYQFLAAGVVLAGVLLYRDDRPVVGGAEKWPPAQGAVKCHYAGRG